VPTAIIEGIEQLAVVIVGVVGEAQPAHRRSTTAGRQHHGPISRQAFRFEDGAVQSNRRGRLVLDRCRQAWL
jgi:hypothetical protein